ncbi:hypothetical protein [Formosa algae]|uniref:hypothetical protein n=1 Tax=Formosa algae TaxID=225843 RepID=UPI0015596849|nr:hypothetical protein [Formosa algae]
MKTKCLGQDSKAPKEAEIWGLAYIRFPISEFTSKLFFVCSYFKTNASIFRNK